MSELILPPHIEKYRREKQPDLQIDMVVVTSVDKIKGRVITDKYAILDDEVIDTIQEIIEISELHKQTAITDMLMNLGWTPPPVELPA